MVLLLRLLRREQEQQQQQPEEQELLSALAAVGPRRQLRSVPRRPRQRVAAAPPSLEGPPSRRKEGNLEKGDFFFRKRIKGETKTGKKRQVKSEQGTRSTTITTMPALPIGIVFLGATEPAFSVALSS